MGIQEGTLLEQLGIAVPAQGIALAGSIGIDLNPDFGAGDQTQAGPGRPTRLLRSAGMPGQAGELMIRVDVTTDFVGVVGVPVTAALVQFHAVMAVSGGNILSSANDNCVVGSNTGPMSIEAVDLNIVKGYLAAELTVGKSFFVRINPWVPTMGRSTVTSAALEAKDLRYLGLVMLITTARGGGAESYFSAGAVIGKIVLQSEIAWDPTDFIYPSAVDYV